MVQLNPEHDKTWKKGIIEKKLNENSYRVDVDGNTYRRNIINIRTDGSRERIQETGVEQIKINEKLQTERVPQSQVVQDSGEGEETRKDEKKEYPQRDGTETGEDIPIVPKEPENSEIKDEKKRIGRPKREQKVPEKFKDYITF